MLKLLCKKHPRYDGEKSPRASCEACAIIALQWNRASAAITLTRNLVVNPKKEKQAK